MREKSEGSGEWCTDIRVLLQLLENVDLSSGGRAELVGLRLADAFSADVYYLRGELAARPTLHHTTHRAAHSAAYRRDECTVHRGLLLKMAKDTGSTCRITR